MIDFQSSALGDFTESRLGDRNKLFTASCLDTEISFDWSITPASDGYSPYIIEASNVVAIGMEPPFTYLWTIYEWGLADPFVVGGGPPTVCAVFTTDSFTYIQNIGFALPLVRSLIVNLGVTDSNGLQCHKVVVAATSTFPTDYPALYAAGYPSGFATFTCSALDGLAASVGCTWGQPLFNVVNCDDPYTFGAGLVNLTGEWGSIICNSYNVFQLVANYNYNTFFGPILIASAVWQKSDDRDSPTGTYELVFTIGPWSPAATVTVT